MEFYQPTDELEGEVAAARLKSWAIVSGVGLGMYLLLFGIVRRGSNTIVRQRRALEHQVVQLSDLLEQNDRLHDRVRRAAEHTTALNEQSLRRISADLHDGPGQALGWPYSASTSFRASTRPRMQALRRFEVRFRMP